MKVLLINSSPHEKGCTYTALNEISTTLNQEGIETLIYYIGKEPIAPCRDCHACEKLKKCVINDKVNEFLDLASEFDGYVIGSPVHYASASGICVPFLDRVFFADLFSGREIFRLKPACAVVSARRCGTTATLDQLNKYFELSEMPIISSRYLNMVHGMNPDEVKKDKEGMQNMRILAKNMAYFLRCKEAALKMNILPPAKETPIFTNFIQV